MLLISDNGIKSTLTCCQCIFGCLAIGLIAVEISLCTAMYAYPVNVLTTLIQVFQISCSACNIVLVILQQIVNRYSRTMLDSSKRAQNRQRKQKQMKGDSNASIFSMTSLMNANFDFHRSNSKVYQQAQLNQSVSEKNVITQSDFGVEFNDFHVTNSNNERNVVERIVDEIKSPFIRISTSRNEAYGNLTDLGDIRITDPDSTDNHVFQSVHGTIISDSFSCSLVVITSVLSFLITLPAVVNSPVSALILSSVSARLLEILTAFAGISEFTINDQKWRALLFKSIGSSSPNSVREKYNANRDNSKKPRDSQVSPQVRSSAAYNDADIQRLLRPSEAVQNRTDINGRKHNLRNMYASNNSSFNNGC